MRDLREAKEGLARENKGLESTADHPQLLGQK